MLRNGPHAALPSPHETHDALLRVADLLGVERCWVYRRRYHFPLPGRDGWTIAFSAESAGRFRLEACHWTRPAVTLWTLAKDADRLAGLVRELQDEIGVCEGVGER